MVVAVLFATAIGWFFYHLLSGDGNVSRDGGQDGRTEVLCAVPMDAVAVYQTRSISDAGEVLSSFAPDYSFLISSLPQGGSDIEGAVSVHSIGKNLLSLLMVCVIPESADCDSIIRGVVKKCAGVIQKNYDGSIIYRSSVPDLNLAVYGHFLLCSSSVTLLESSIRLLDSGESLLDNPTFVDAVRGGRSSSSVVINNNSLGKVISVFGRSSFKRITAFASHITDWSFFEINNPEEGLLTGNGVMAQLDERACYSYVLHGQKGSRSDLTDILPYNTVAYLSIRLSDSETFINRYAAFRHSLGRKKSSADSLLTIAAKSGVSEVVKAVVALPDSYEKIVLLKADKPEYFCPEGEMSDSCSCAGVAAAVAGDFFAVPDSSACCSLSSDWVALGTRKAVSWYLSTSRNVNFFALSDWLSQTPVKINDTRNTVVSSMVNLSLLSDSLDSALKDRYAEPIRSCLAEHNLNFFTFNVNTDSGNQTLRYCLLSRTIERMPTLKSSVTVAAVAEDDTLINIPEGPFSVVDFRNGKKNTLEQLSDERLRLVDERGKILWTIPFEGRICGKVAQIDYIKNDKLQMLFASGTKIYLKTRLGGDVKPFPAETESEILLGPDVFDFNGNREYLLAVLHKDNVIRFYDRDGCRAAGYGEITAPERIKKLPEPILMAGQVLWAVRTSGQTLIVNSGGTAVANFNRKRRLAPDSEINILSDEELVVTTAEGREMILNIVTGNFSKK